MIYKPALPCSMGPIEGLADMETPPGLGARCKWELLTRDADGLERLPEGLI